MIPPTSYIGPTYDRTEQRTSTIKISGNETPSHIPRCNLSDSLSLSVDTEFRRLDPLKDVYLNEAIRGHCETRFQILYSQLLLIAGSGLVFEMRGALDQATRGGYIEAYDTQEAHSALISTLICHFPDDRHNKFLFGNKGYFFNSWNTTTTLPTDCNKVDSFLEKTTVDGLSLRDAIINVYNKVSKNEKTPDDAFKEILTYFVLALDKADENFQKQDKRQKYPQALPTIGFYRKVAKSYQWLIEDNALSTHPYFRETATNEVRKRFLADMKVHQAYSHFVTAAENQLDKCNISKVINKQFLFQAYLAACAISLTPSQIPSVPLERLTDDTREYVLAAMKHTEIRSLALAILSENKAQPYLEACRDNQPSQVRALPLGMKIDGKVKTKAGRSIQNIHHVAALVLHFVAFEKVTLDSVEYGALLAAKQFPHAKYMTDPLMSDTLVSHIQDLSRSPEVTQAANRVLEVLAIDYAQAHRLRKVRIRLHAKQI